MSISAEQIERKNATNSCAGRAACPLSAFPVGDASSAEAPGALEEKLASMLTSSAYNDNPGFALQCLLEADLADLPLPGHGETLRRWQALAAVAAFDLSLAKLYEGHTDALAIQAELGVNVPAGGVWGVWCAEPPSARLSIVTNRESEPACALDGRKAWCSGAETLTYALVSGWNEAGEQCLAAVRLAQPGITVTDEGWHAVGMQRSVSVDVIFEQAAGVPVGMPGGYVSRPGFWHGGAGVAACWYGAAVAIAQRLHQSASSETDAHGKAHLGAIDVALSGAAAVLRETAAFIDAHPKENAMQRVLRTRLCVEHAATAVIAHATRALGAGPLCRDAHFSRMVADLPVFLRQSHAERDLQALGESLVQPSVQTSVETRLMNEQSGAIAPELRRAPWAL